jgi:hypothetical protein
VDRGEAMTRPLRRRHLQIWIVLAFALPVLFVAAVAARRETTPINGHFEWEQLP